MSATVWHTLVAPWHSGLDRRAVAEIALLGITGGVLGCWIIFYNLSYGAESLAHSLLPGMVLSVLAGVPLVIGGGIGMLLAALGVGPVARLRGLDRDTAVAVVVTPLLGLGALLALSPRSPAALGELLFGDVLGVSRADLLIALGLCLGVLAALGLNHGRLLALGFDRETAPALGLRAGRSDALLLTLIAATLLVAVQGLGSLLVVAVLVGPPAAARAVTRRMPSMMAVACLIAIVAGVAGIYVSYYASTAAGASVVVFIVLAHQAAALVGRRTAYPAGEHSPHEPRNTTS